MHSLLNLNFFFYILGEYYYRYDIIYKLIKA
jgi:hypothetical protein